MLCVKNIKPVHVSSCRKHKVSLEVAAQREDFSFHCLTTLLALFSSTWRTSPFYLWQGQLLFCCPSAYPCGVYILVLPSSRHQVEVACGICHAATRAQTRSVSLQSLHPQVLLVWKDTIQKSKIYLLATQPPSMSFPNPLSMLRNRAESTDENIFN